MKIKIRVTKADIMKGQPNISSACPIYLALQRVPSFRRRPIDVYNNTVLIWKNMARLDILDGLPLPAYARRFISRFDKLRDVSKMEQRAGKAKFKPFELNITVPEGFI
jgi:hypothetical protein